MGKVLSFQERTKHIVCKLVERIWHERLLYFVRWSARRELTKHFRDRMVERGISRYDVDRLIEEGQLWAIEIGPEQPNLEWAPKWILRWPSLNDWMIEGVFAYDGERLIGITLYLNGRAEMAAALSRVA